MAKTGHRLTGAINSPQELITDREPPNKATVEAPERLFFSVFHYAAPSCFQMRRMSEKEIKFRVELKT